MNAAICQAPLGITRKRIHSTWTAAMPNAYRRVAERKGPAERDARSHCATIAMRMTTYPRTVIVKSPSLNALGIPAATTRTPPI